jgi:dihydropteroate synthase
MMHDEQIHVNINDLDIGDRYPVRVMGVLNVSQESFYKRSVVDARLIQERARTMITNGASFLDVGGRSTAPNVKPITVDEEGARVVQALNALLPMIADDKVLVSIDTQFQDVAERALQIFRANSMEKRLVINDVSGLHADSGLARWITDNNVPCILMASHGKAGDSLGIEQTISDIKHSMSLLDTRSYHMKEKVIIDPAIGRWIPAKLPAFDLELVHELPTFRSIGAPILVAISRKSFIGEILGEKDPENRFFGTLSATAIAVFNGAHVVRTHDVNKETIDTIKVAEAIKQKQGMKNPS